MSEQANGFEGIGSRLNSLNTSSDNRPQPNIRHNQIEEDSKANTSTLKVTCLDCHKEFSRGDEVCPYCGLFNSQKHADEKQPTKSSTTAPLLSNTPTSTSSNTKKKSVIASILSSIPIGWYVLGAIAAAIYLYGQYESSSRARLDSSFKSVAQSYKNYTNYTYVPLHLSGKIAVFGWSDDSLDAVHFQLPPTIQAQSPSEVSAVAFVSCIETEVGRYTSGSIGYKTDCTINIIDPITSSRYDHTVSSGNPPQSKKGKGNWSYRPNKEMAEYLQSLFH